MTASFADYARQHADARFTDWLRDAAEPSWAAATTHRFSRELADDTLDPTAYRRYLIQDYVFIDALARLVGFAVGQAPGMSRKARFAGFLSALTDAENSYFLRSFEALGVAEADWRGATRNDVTRDLAALFEDAIAANGYAEILAVLVPVEWVYLTWATNEAGKRPSRFYYDEWIVLHNDPGFRDFVNWMRRELDDAGAALPKDAQARLAGLFRRACELEVQFFDSAYR